MHLSLAEMGLFPLFLLHFPSATHNQRIPACSCYQFPEQGDARLFKRQTAEGAGRSFMAENLLVYLLVAVGINNREHLPP